MDTQKTVAIVTGASQGIGRATALRVVRDFWGIVLAARNADALNEVASAVKTSGAESLVCALDLSQVESAKTLVKTKLDRFGRIDALLNIAGAVPQIDLFEMTDEQWRAGAKLKLHSARRLTIRAWEALKHSKGSVVFMSGSAASTRSLPSRRLLRLMPPLPPSRRHLPNKVSETEFRSTASSQGR
jgi:3-oxoacyl-[acyl-carrier protein] reductase